MKVHILIVSVLLPVGNSQFCEKESRIASSCWYTRDARVGLYEILCAGHYKKCLEEAFVCLKGPLSSFGTIPLRHQK